MPYPRRVIIYLREKGIPSSLVKVVPVTDPQLGDSVPPEFPPKPTGSLPILAIPPGGYRNNQLYTYIRQSNAIMSFLDELCEEGSHGFHLCKGSMRGTDPLSRARNMELLALADECLPTGIQCVSLAPELALQPSLPLPRRWSSGSTGR